MQKLAFNAVWGITIQVIPHTSYLSLSQLLQPTVAVSHGTGLNSKQFGTQ